MYPLTPIFSPGPISRGTAENKALRATAFELIDDNRDCKREMPSFVEDGAVALDIGAGASGSVGEAL